MLGLGLTLTLTLEILFHGAEELPTSMALSVSILCFFYSNCLCLVLNGISAENLLPLAKARRIIVFLFLCFCLHVQNEYNFIKLFYIHA